LLGRRILVGVQPFLLILENNCFAFNSSASHGFFLIASSNFVMILASFTLFFGESIAHTAFLPPAIAVAHIAIGVTIGANEEAHKSPSAVVSSIISVLGIPVTLCTLDNTRPIVVFACLDHFKSTLSFALYSADCLSKKLRTSALGTNSATLLFIHCLNSRSVLENAFSILGSNTVSHLNACISESSCFLMSKSSAGVYESFVSLSLIFCMILNADSCISQTIIGFFFTFEAKSSINVSISDFLIFTSLQR
jgi:hypothetical protein